MRITNKKTLLVLGVSLALTVVALTANAVLPPKYLSVPNFNQCLGNKDMGTWTAWCMPASKPAACSAESWQQLEQLTNADRLPEC
jgi:hypothetical protein